MAEKADPIFKIIAVFESHWPVMIGIVGGLTLLFFVAFWGIWFSVMRRNTLLNKLTESLRYQNELLKWIGTTLKEKDPGEMG